MDHSRITTAVCVPLAPQALAEIYPPDRDEVPARFRTLIDEGMLSEMSEADYWQVWPDS